MDRIRLRRCLGDTFQLFLMMAVAGGVLTSLWLLDRCNQPAL